MVLGTLDENLIEKIYKKSNIGIACKGNGLLSATTLIGWISALNKLNIFNKFKYISGSSGSNWFLVFLYYYNFEFDDYFSPNNCTLNNLDNIKDNSYINVFINTNFEKRLLENLTIKELLNDNINQDPWIDTIMCSFYKNQLDYRKNKDYENVIYENIESLPYLIINSTAYKNNRIYPVEFTALYYSLITDYKEDLRVKPIDFCNNFFITPEKQSAIGSNVFGYLQEGLPNYLQSYLQSIEDNLTKPVDLIDKITNNWEKYSLIDSGFFDNTGILALIRKKINTILYLFTSSIEITDPEFEDTTKEAFTAVYFGRATSTNGYKYKVPIDKYNSNYKIFNSELWDDLKSDLINKYRLGLPLFHLIETVTLKNEYIGVESYPIKILFIMNSKSMNWINNLPCETSNQLDKNFPFLNLLSSTYDIFNISTLYQKAFWDIITINEIFDINYLFE